MNESGFLLQKLASAGRVSGVGTSGARDGAISADGEVDFAGLLQRARSGELTTGREVSVGREAGIELNSEQLKRLSAAVDLAEAHGADHAVVMIDGLALKVDVAARTVVGVVNTTAPGVTTGIEALVVAAGREGSEGDAGARVVGMSGGSGGSGAGMVLPPPRFNPASGALAGRARDGAGGNA